MTSIRRSWSWLAFAAGLAACSSESGTNDNQGGQSICTDGTTLPCPCNATTQGIAMCVNGQWSTTCMCPPGTGTGGFPQGTGGNTAGTGGYSIGTGGIVGAGGIPVGAGGFVLGSGGSDGGSSNNGGTTGTGGSGGGDGGMVGTGGADGGPPSTGGATSDGGSPSTGGAQTTGGAPNTGGLTGDGGTPGTGGAPSTGGAPNTGGAPSTGGAPNTGGSPSTGGATGTGGAATVADPTLPAPPSNCPTLKTGTISVPFASSTAQTQQVQLWVGAKRTDVKGPVMFYWHGTGSQSGEAGLLGPALQEIQNMGGIVASFTTSTGSGATTGNNVWYVGDYQMADYILGCAIQQLNIDTHQIYTAGCSAGGLQAGSMVYARANYLAGAMPNSGGNFTQTQFQSATHTPSVITVHGGDNDFGGIFGPASTNLCTAVANRGGYATDCNHGGGHCQAPADLVAAQWTYLKAHPYGVATDPYAGGLPSPTFPNYCTQF